MKTGGKKLAFVIALLLLASLLVCAAVANALLADASRAMAEKIVQTIETEIGFRISYEALSPSIFRSIDLRGVEISYPYGPVFLKARRLSLQYDLMALLSGKTSEVIVAVEMGDAVVELDLRRDLDYLGRTIARLAAGGEGGGLGRFRVLGRNIAIDMRDGEDSVETRVQTCSLEIDPTSIAFDADAVAELSIRGFPAGRLDLSARGTMDPGLSSIRAIIGAGFGNDDFRIDKRSYAFVKSGNVIDLRSVASDEPLELRLTADLFAKEFSVAARFERFVPETLVSVERNPDLRQWLYGDYSGSLWASGDLSFADIDWRLDLRGALPRTVAGASWNYAFMANGDLSRVTFERASLFNEHGSISYSGGLDLKSLLPNGSVTVDYAFIPGAQPMKGEIRVESGNGMLFAMAPSLDVAGTRFTDLLATASIDGNQVEAELSIVIAGKTDDFAVISQFGAESASQRITANAMIDLSEKSPFLELAFDTDVLSLSYFHDILAGVGLPETLLPITDSMKATVNGFFSTDFVSFSYSLPSIIVTYDGLDGSFGAIRLSGTLDSVDVESMLFSYSGYVLEGKGMADFSDPDEVSFSCDLMMQDIPYELRGSIIEGSSLLVTGSYGFALNVSSSDGAVRAALGMKDLPVVVGGSSLLLGADLKAGYVGPSDWRIDVASFGLGGTMAPGLYMPDILVSGAFDPDGGFLDSIAVSDSYSTMTGSATVSYDLADFRSIDVALAVEDKVSKEYLRGNASIGEAALSGRIDFGQLRLDRFTASFGLSGTASGSVDLGGTPDSPEAAFDLNLPAGMFMDLPVSADVSGLFNPLRLEIRNANASWSGHVIRSGRGAFGFADNTFFAATDYAYRLGTRFFECEITADGGPSETGYRADARLERLALGELYAEAWDLAFSYVEGEGIEILGGAAPEVVVHISPTGSFDATLTAPFPITGTASGTLEDTIIDGKATIEKASARFVMALLGMGEIEATQGEGSGELAMRGPVTDPSFYGSLTMRDLKIAVPIVLEDPVGPMDATFVFDDKAIRSSMPVVRCGEGIVSFDLSVVLGQLNLVEAVLDLNVPEDYPIRSDLSSLPMMDIRGLVNGRIKMTFVEGGMTLEGALNLSKTVIEVNPAKTAASEASGGAWNNRIDLSVTTGSDVQVFFPTRQIPIISGYADQSSKVRVLMDGGAGELSVTGQLVLRSGTVYYVQRNFMIKSGSVVFNENERQFDPRVTIYAERRDRYKDAPIVILLKANSQSLLSFTPTLESYPSLTQGEIVSLLGESLFAADEQTGEIDLSKALIVSSEILSQSSLLQGIENTVKETFGLDMFTVRTELFQRWLLDLVYPSETGTSDISKYFDNTSVYIGKYINDVLFFQAVGRLQWTSNPLVTTGGLTLDSTLGIEFNTPYFLLQWNISPLHPETLFISDQSISILWTLSF